MKISRWIYFPIVYTILYTSWMILYYWLFDLPPDSFMIFLWLTGGVLIGFSMLYSSNKRAKKLSNGKDERVFDVRQNRNLMILLEYERAFNLCREAAFSINPAKIKEESLEKGIIKFRTRMSWKTWGIIVTISLNKVNEKLTEAEIRTRPIPQTALISDGYSWKIAEDICTYLKEKDAEINKKVLIDSAEILDDVYVKPFQKEKVRVER